MELVDALTKRFGKYALVVGVSRRAYDLRERIDMSRDPSGGGLVNRALGEIARGEVHIRGEKPGKKPE